METVREERERRLRAKLKGSEKTAKAGVQERHRDEVRQEKMSHSKCVYLSV